MEHHNIFGGTSLSSQIKYSNFIWKIWCWTLSFTISHSLLWFWKINVLERWQFIYFITRHKIFPVFSNLLTTLFYLNNEKLPFMLELSSIHQMYLKVLKRLFTMFPRKKLKTFSSVLNTVYLLVCNRKCHPSMFNGVSQKGTFIHSPWSTPIIQMTLCRRTSVWKHSYQTCPV